MKLFGDPMNAFLESRRFFVLLVALVFAIFVAPLLATPASQSTWFRISVWTVILAGLYAASNREAYRLGGAALVVLALFAWLGPDLLAPRIDQTLRLITIAGCFSFTAMVVGQAILRHDSVSRETLLGGINVYLLLGFAFAIVHASIELAVKGSYMIRGQPLFDLVASDYDGRAFATLLYFSFTTLTTLGFGDIVPETDGARLTTTVEAVVGQLYIAIFIGRLVGLEVGERTAIRREAAQRSTVLESGGAPDGGPPA